jgi:membrane-bound lytic murein transglycosylase B
MTMQKQFATFLAAASLSLALTGVAAANHTCRNVGTFEQWMARFKQEALASGISQTTVSRALDGVTYDPAVIRRDHGQGVFQQSFIQFSDRMTNKGRFQTGQAQLKKHAQLFARIEQQFGVPASVIVAFWGLETDYGAEKAQLFPVLRSMATLPALG